MVPLVAGCLVMMVAAMALKVAGAGRGGCHGAHDGKGANERDQSLDAELHRSSPVLQTRALKHRAYG
jgi:hypothetical protein